MRLTREEVLKLKLTSNQKAYVLRQDDTHTFEVDNNLNINCIRCVNCFNCSNCSDCCSCRSCDYCYYCISCRDCNGCYSCIGCEDCNNCVHCTNCNGFDYRRNDIGLISSLKDTNLVKGRT